MSLAVRAMPESAVFHQEEPRHSPDRAQTARCDARAGRTAANGCGQIRPLRDVDPPPKVPPRSGGEGGGEAPGSGNPLDPHGIDEAGAARCTPYQLSEATLARQRLIAHDGAESG